LKLILKENGFDLSNTHKHTNDAVLNLTGIYSGAKNEYGIIFETKNIQKNIYKKKILKNLKKYIHGMMKF
jgi:hypothetical protein